MTAMRMSAGLAVIGVLLLCLQLIWAPGDGVPMVWVFAPVIVGLTAISASVVLGVARGTRLFRAAILLGLLGMFAVVASLALPLDRGAAGPRPSPTNGDLVLIVGVVLILMSSIIGAIAIAPTGRRSFWSRSTIPHDLT